MDLPSVTMSHAWGLVSGQWQVPCIVARATLGMLLASLFQFSTFFLRDEGHPCCPGFLSTLSQLVQYVSGE